MTTYSISVRGDIIRTNIADEGSALHYISQLTMRADRRDAQIIAEVPPPPPPPVPSLIPEPKPKTVPPPPPLIPHTLVTVYGKEKGDQAVALTDFPSKERADLIMSEKKWGGSRGSPAVIPTSEVSAYIKKHSTGEFAVGYVAPTPEKVAADITRAKEQETFERERAKVSAPRETDPVTGQFVESPEEYKERVELGTQLLGTKYGIIPKAPEPTQQELTEQKILGDLAAGTTATYGVGAKPAIEPTPVLFSEKAFEQAKEVLIPKGEGILPTPTPTDKKPYAIAQIIPDVAAPKESILVPLVKPEGLIVKAPEEKVKKVEEVEVLFSEKAFEQAKKVLTPSKDILEPSKDAKDMIEPSKIAKIVPDVKDSKEAILVPLYKPEGLIVKAPEDLTAKAKKVAKDVLGVLPGGQAAKAISDIAGSPIVKKVVEKAEVISTKASEIIKQVLPSIKELEIMGEGIKAKLPARPVETRPAVKLVKELWVGVSEGAYEQIREKPIETAASLAVGGAFGAGIKILSVTKAGSVVAKVGGAALGITYGAAVTKEVIAAPTLQAKAKVIGGTAVELAAFGVGAKIGGAVITTKTSKAATILEQLKKEPTPVIKGEQYYGLEKVKIDIKTTEQIKAPTYEITKPSELVTSKYRIDVAKPTITVAESVTGAGVSKYRAVTTPTSQHITVTIPGKKPAYVRTTIDPTGKAVTKVYEGDVLLKTTKPKLEPTIKFTEPSEIIKTKSYVSMPEMIKQVDSKIAISKGVSLIKKGDVKAVGTRQIKTQEKLMTVTEALHTKTLQKPFVDLATGKKGMELKSLEIVPTKYKYVDYLAKEKVLKKEVSAEGLFMDKPATSMTKQTTIIKDHFTVGMEKKVPVEAIKKQKPTVEQVHKDIFYKVRDEVIAERMVKGKDIGTILKKQQKAVTKKILKEAKQITEQKAKGKVVEIQRPTTKAKLKDIEVYIPKYETVAKVKTPLAAVSIAGKTVVGSMPVVVTKVKPTTRISPTLEVTPISRAIQEPISRAKAISKPLTRAIPISKPISRMVQKPRVIQELIQKPKLIPKTRITPITRVPTYRQPPRVPTYRRPPPRPPPSISFPRGMWGDRKRKRKLMPWERGYKGTISMSVLMGGRGQVLTKQQMLGKQAISPLALRALPKRALPNQQNKRRRRRKWW